MVGQGKHREFENAIGVGTLSKKEKHYEQSMLVF